MYSVAYLSGTRCLHVNPFKCYTVCVCLTTVWSRSLFASQFLCWCTLKPCFLSSQVKCWFCWTVTWSKLFHLRNLSTGNLSSLVEHVCLLWSVCSGGREMVSLSWPCPSHFTCWSPAPPKWGLCDWVGLLGVAFFVCLVGWFWWGAGGGVLFLLVGRRVKGLGWDWQHKVCHL